MPGVPRWNINSERQISVGLREPGIGDGIPRVVVDRRLKQLNGPVQVWRREVVPAVASAQIKIECAGAAGLWHILTGPIGRKPHLDLPAYRGCQLLLDADEAGGAAIIGRVPHLILVASANQPGDD